jgi:hypothetical protein
MMPRTLSLRHAPALLLAFGTVIGFAHHALAAPPGPAPSGSTTKAYQSSGLRASINRINTDNRGVSIQFVVENTTNVRQYVMLYGSFEASLDTGAVGRNEVTGLEFCDSWTNPDSATLSRCLEGKAKEINNFSYIEPGEFTTALFHYNVNGSAAANTISFSFKAIVRTAVGDADQLGGGGTSKAAGAPRVVNINFPLIPLKAAE